MKNVAHPEACQAPDANPRVLKPYVQTESALRYRTDPNNSNDPGEWISDGFRLLAQVNVERPIFLPRSDDWAVIIEFHQPNGTTHRSLIYYGDLHVRCKEVVAGLSRAGMRIAVDRVGRTRFLNYLMRVRPPTLLRLGELTVQGVERVLCLRPEALSRDGGAYEPRFWHFYELYDRGQKLPQVIHILDQEDVI